MKRYSHELKEKVRQLRTLGKTFTEIRNELGLNLSKSTLSEWCQSVQLPSHYQLAIDALNKKNLCKARTIAISAKALKRKVFFEDIIKKNSPIALRVNEKDFSKIALAMLCLGEASKSKSKSSAFSLGNSDPRIIILFIKLLENSIEFDRSKIRCGLQCRADQNIEELESYWQKITNIPKEKFYKALVDPRTVGKPTRRSDYKGVLRVYYMDTKVQLELESLADLTYNQILKGP